jgi:uncharacterized membrane protein YkvA (DUF1232 family)
MKRFFAQPLYNLFRKLIRNPRYRWFILAGSLIYLLSPLDLSPDVFPVIGWLDDGMIATLVVAEVSQILLDRRRAQKDQHISVASSTPTASGSESTIDVKAVEATV